MKNKKNKEERLRWIKKVNKDKGERVRKIKKM